MAFVLCNAPTVFKSLMEKVLGNLCLENCICYLDDIIGFGKDFETAHERLQFVSSKLREGGLKHKPKKCLLFCEEVTYFGH